MRVLFALAGLHRVRRGAEVAFESIAHELAEAGDSVTLIGSGPPIEGRSYEYIAAGVIPRERFERFPRLPVVARSEYVYEELSWLPGLLRRYRPSEYDITVTCGYPYTNWVLRAVPSRHRPKHVFVTENGDLPARSNKREFRIFGCDGLVCTNPDYFEANRQRWNAALIPNGLDTDRFHPGAPDRERFDLPPDRPVVLMASALIDSKRVDDAIRVVARSACEPMLVVAGDGPSRGRLDALASQHLPGRFKRLVVAPTDMPALYRSADVFLHLSIEEAFGNVYIEAAASGLPVVAHDSASTRWILGDGAQLVDTLDLDATAAAIDRCLQAPPGDLGDRAELVRERFAWEAIGADYRAFFEQVLGPDGA
jgi:glycosyltransferase involved in cell wall biosynthesis